MYLLKTSYSKSQLESIEVDHVPIHPLAVLSMILQWIIGWVWIDNPQPLLLNKSPVMQIISHVSCHLCSVDVLSFDAQNVFHVAKVFLSVHVYVSACKTPLALGRISIAYSLCPLASFSKPSGGDQRRGTVGFEKEARSVQLRFSLSRLYLSCVNYIKVTVGEGILRTHWLPCGNSFWLLSC